MELTITGVKNLSHDKHKSDRLVAGPDGRLGHLWAFSLSDGRVLKVFVADDDLRDVRNDKEKVELHDAILLWNLRRMLPEDTVDEFLARGLGWEHAGG